MEEEIAQLVAKAVRDNAPEPKEVVFPEVQRVEIENLPAPPETPKIDFGGLEKVIREFLNKETTPPTDMREVENLLTELIEKDQPDNKEALGKILKAVTDNKPLPVDLSNLLAEMRAVVGAVKQVRDKPFPMHRGGAIGPSKISIKETLPRVDTPETFEDTSFVSGDSPVTLDANAALGRNATEFSIQNDGPGNFTVSLSTDGTIFGDEKTVFDGEVYGIDVISVDSIRITHAADSAYRVTVL